MSANSREGERESHSVKSAMISSFIIPFLISSIKCGLYSQSYNGYHNGYINSRQGGEYTHSLHTPNGPGTYANSYVSSVPFPSPSYSNPSYIEPSNEYSSPLSSSNPIALIINTYPPTKLEEVKAINQIDSHYSRPIKYRPSANRIAPSQNWYDTLVSKPHSTTLPPPIELPTPIYVSPSYQPDMSK
ncbi:hypothetical protein PENTCL1PPCAC_17565, partial [Pristionchus entomophagus]